MNGHSSRSALERFDDRPRVELLVWLVAAFAPYYLSAAFSILLDRPAETATYGSFEKPWFAPPGWAFFVAWTVNFGLAGVGAWLVSRSNASWPTKRVAFVAFGTQVLLNFASTFTEIDPDAPGPNYAILALVFVAASANGLANARADRYAGLVLVPYVLWVAFASAVVHSIAQLN